VYWKEKINDSNYYVCFIAYFKYYILILLVSLQLENQQIVKFPPKLLSKD